MIQGLQDALVTRAGNVVAAEHSGADGDLELGSVVSFVTDWCF